MPSSQLKLTSWNFNPEGTLKGLASAYMQATDESDLIDYAKLTGMDGSSFARALAAGARITTGWSQTIDRLIDFNDALKTVNSLSETIYLGNGSDVMLIGKRNLPLQIKEQNLTISDTKGDDLYVISSNFGVDADNHFNGIHIFEKKSRKDTDIVELLGRGWTKMFDKKRKIFLSSSTTASPSPRLYVSVTNVERIKVAGKTFTAEEFAAVPDFSVLA